jgi:hypothetical protein
MNKADFVALIGQQNSVVTSEKEPGFNPTGEGKL